MRRPARLGWLWRWVVLAVGVGAWQLWASGKHSPFFPPPSAGTPPHDGARVPRSVRMRISRPGTAVPRGKNDGHRRGFSPIMRFVHAFE